eukprot:15241903-Alexandrium_andersonii.AAC.1
MGASWPRSSTTWRLSAPGMRTTAPRKAQCSTASCARKRVPVCVGCWDMTSSLSGRAIRRSSAGCSVGR